MAIDKSITNSVLKYPEHANNILSYPEYVKIAYRQDKRTKNFFDNTYIFNKNTGLINNIKFNKEWHLRQSYLYNTFRIDYLNQECINDGMIPIFLTITLPSSYHAFKHNKSKTKIIKNPRHNPNITVNDGYQKLQEIFRSVYHDFKIDRKRVKDLKFIRVIEPHKTWTPHLHAIVYVPKKLKWKFLKHFIRIKRNNGLKQVDIKILDTAKYAVTYLLKYIDKTLSGSDEIRGWKIHHEIKRSLTMSNLGNGITRNIFKRVSQFIKYDKDDKDNSYLHQILNKVSIDRFQVDEKHSIIKSQKFGVSTASISVVEVVQKVRKISQDTWNDDINIDDDMLYEDESLYKIIDTIVFDEFEEVYSMRDNVFYRGDFILEPDIPKYDFLLCIEQGSEKMNI